MSNIKYWLNNSENILFQSKISTARLDCIVLLEDEIKKDRTWILANPEFELSEKNIKNLEEKILRRSKHEPLAYIRGKSEFYGRKFIVNNHTLEPRPETETMIDMLKKLPSDFNTLVDVGTGSGAIAITVKLLYPDKQVFAIDIDNKCTQTALANAKLHNVNINFLHGNLLEPFLENSSKKFNSNDTWVVLANLPYIPDSHTINQSAMFEPKHAIFGGKDGLNYYREMFNQIDKFNKKLKFVLTESLPYQHDELKTIAEKSGYKLTKTGDFIQVFK